jgi:hypothetical protein
MGPKKLKADVHCRTQDLYAEQTSSLTSDDDDDDDDDGPRLYIFCFILFFVIAVILYT